MTDHTIGLSFIRSTDVHAMMLSDYNFARLVPDEFTKDMRRYILELLNGLTGGELEQYMKTIEVMLAKEQKNASAQLKKMYRLEIVPNN